MNTVINTTLMFVILLLSGIYEANAMSSEDEEVRDVVAYAVAGGAVVGLTIAAPAVVIGASVGAATGAAVLAGYELYKGEEVVIPESIKLPTDYETMKDSLTKSFKKGYYSVKDTTEDVSKKAIRKVEDIRGKDSLTVKINRELQDMENAYERTIRDLSL